MEWKKEDRTRGRESQDRWADISGYSIRALNKDKVHKTIRAPVTHYSPIKKISHPGNISSRLT